MKTSIGSELWWLQLFQYENEAMLIESLDPLWCPKFTMTDKSSVELNAIGKVFLAAIHLLYDFHKSQADQCQNMPMTSINKIQVK